MEKNSIHHELEIIITKCRNMAVEIKCRHNTPTMFVIILSLGKFTKECSAHKVLCTKSE